MSTTVFFLLLGITTPANARQDKPEKQEERAKPERKEQEAKPERQQQAKAPERKQDTKPERQQQANGQQKQKQQQDSPANQQQQAKGQEHHQQQQQDRSVRQEQQQAKGQQEQQQKRQQQDDKSAKHDQQQAKGREEQYHQQEARSGHAPQRTREEETRHRAQPALRLSARGDGRISDERFRSHFGREHDFHVGNPVLVGGYSRFRYGGYWFGFVEPWPADWYYTDDVYIDYVDGGYYMYNPYYPGTRFAISVVL
jgi:hypothetical protein